MTLDEIKASLPKPEKASKEFCEWFEIAMKGFLVVSVGKAIASGKELPPIFVAFKYGEDEPKVIPIPPFRNQHDKDRAALAHRLMATAPFCEAIIYIAEAWIVNETAENSKAEEQLKQGIPLEHYPGRTEGVIFSALRGGQQLFASVPIDPGPPRKLGELKEIVDPMGENEYFRGRFVLAERDPKREH